MFCLLAAASNKAFFGFRRLLPELLPALQHDATGFRGLSEGGGSGPVVLAHRAGEVYPGGQPRADRRLGPVQDTL